MTLVLPMAHAYLVAGDPERCVATVQDELADLFADRQESLEIDAGVVETLTVDMARSLNQRGRQRSKGETRCSIRGFQLATQPAQNALLKTLEEPAEGVHFFLVTPIPKHLLETVRSRTTELDLCGYTDEAVEELVNEFLQAYNLPDRLEVITGVLEKEYLVGFIAGLAKSVGSDNVYLQEALQTVTPWLQEPGRSDKQIGEFLAIAASQDNIGN